MKAFKPFFTREMLKRFFSFDNLKRFVRGDPPDNPCYEVSIELRVMDGAEQQLALLSSIREAIRKIEEDSYQTSSPIDIENFKIEIRHGFTNLQYMYLVFFSALPYLLILVGLLINSFIWVM